MTIADLLSICSRGGHTPTTTYSVQSGGQGSISTPTGDSSTSPSHRRQVNIVQPVVDLGITEATLTSLAKIRSFNPNTQLLSVSRTGIVSVSTCSWIKRTFKKDTIAQENANSILTIRKNLSPPAVGRIQSIDQLVGSLPILNTLPIRSNQPSPALFVQERISEIKAYRSFSTHSSGSSATPSTPRSRDDRFTPSHYWPDSTPHRPDSTPIDEEKTEDQSTSKLFLPPLKNLSATEKAKLLAFLKDKDSSLTEGDLFNEDVGAQEALATHAFLLEYVFSPRANAFKFKEEWTICFYLERPIEVKNEDIIALRKIVPSLVADPFFENLEQRNWTWA